MLKKVTEITPIKNATPSAFQWVENIQQYKPKPRDIYVEEMEVYNDSRNPK